MLLIMATRWANRQVEMVSSAWSDVAATLAIIKVLHTKCYQEVQNPAFFAQSMPLCILYDAWDISCTPITCSFHPGCPAALW